MDKVKIKLSDLKSLLNDHDVYIDTPEGISKISNAYRKNGPGKVIDFSDNTQIICADNHLMTDDNQLYNWIDAHKFNVGDYINGKDVVNITDSGIQEWYDFTVENETSSYYHNGIVHHNSGKSLIAYLFYRYCMDNNISLLITVPSVGLVSQLYSDFQDYVSDDHNVEDNVHCIFAGQEKDTNKKCVISTWQSLATIEDPTWFKRFGFYICDEAHLAKGAEISKIIDKLNTCRYRVGMTGTLSGAAMHEIEMQARFGDIFKMVTTRELIDRGILTDIHINCMRLTYSKDEVKRFNAFCKKDYQREIDYILNSVERNDYIVELGLTTPGTSLMLFNRVEGHGMLLMEMLEAKCVEHKKKVFYISGKVKAKERERIRKLLDGEMPLYNTVTFTDGSTKIFDDEVQPYRDITSMVGSSLPDTYYAENDNTSRIVANVDQSEGAYVLLASYGTMSTGISIKKLDSLILCHPYKGRILNLQSIGRILRKSITKDLVELYDLIDDFRMGKKENHTYKHGTIRMEIYESEEFEYDIIEKKLN